jgi:hypothetical protein
MKPLKEGNQKLGGIKNPPTTPRPAPPKGQGGAQAQAMLEHAIAVNQRAPGFDHAIRMMGWAQQLAGVVKEMVTMAPMVGEPLTHAQEQTARDFLGEKEELDQSHQLLDDAVVTKGPLPLRIKALLTMLRSAEGQVRELTVCDESGHFLLCGTCPYLRKPNCPSAVRRVEGSGACGDNVRPEAIEFRALRNGMPPSGRHG